MPAAHPIEETTLATQARPVAYVSADTLASLLDVSETTIWEWQRKGILPRAQKIGGATRWKWSEVEAKIRGRTEERDPILEAAGAR